MTDDNTGASCPQDDEIESVEAELKAAQRKVIPGYARRVIDIIAGLGIAAIAAAWLATPAQADPDDGGVGSGPSKVHFCPDTGQMVSWLAPCPSLITGPYLPGGLVPNSGGDR